MGEEQYLQAGDYVSVRFLRHSPGSVTVLYTALEYMDQMGYACWGDSVEITLIDAVLPMIHPVCDGKYRFHT